MPTFHCLLRVAALCAALHDKPVLALTAIHTAAMLTDGALTAQPGMVERDPICRVFIGRNPTWARMGPSGTAVIVLETYLAERMRKSRSRAIRKMWWTPQIFGMVDSFAGIGYTLTH